MNKADWDSRDSREKDQLVWDCFPEIAPSSDDWVLSNDGGETGFDFFDTEAEAIQDLSGYVEHASLKDATVVHWRHCQEFTTDRNACALVLNEIDRQTPGCIARFVGLLAADIDMCLGMHPWEEGVYAGALADPDLICYCAIKSVEE